MVPLLIVGITIWATFFLENLQWHLYSLPLHSTMEAVEALAVLLLALFFLSRKRGGTEDRFFLVAVGFIGMGIINGFHAASCPGCKFVLLRAAASFAGGLGFVLVWLPSAACRYVSYRKWLPWAAAAGSLAFGIWAFLYPETLPVMVRNDEFTVAAIAINLSAGIFFLAGAGRFLLDFNHSGEAKDYLFFLVGLFFGLAGLMFMYSTLWSAEWWLWHGLRLTASLLVLVFLARKHLQAFTMLEVSNSELKQAEERVRQTIAELERSNRDLEQFAYVVSHDLREPLRTIGGFLNLLQRRHGGQLDSHARELITFTTQGAERLDRMITDLLDYSRIQRQKLVLSRVDLFGVWLKAADNLKAMIEESGARISHDELPVITGDESQLIRLWQNLLSNAIKFRGDRRPEIHIGVREEPDYWLFSVRDNGIGIPPQSAERIFQIFQRLHTQREYPGSGIGLAVCRKIVERHGGRIWMESSPGRGTTFYFTLAGKPR
jgi:signal transduction histidine kinase